MSPDRTRDKLETTTGATVNLATIIDRHAPDRLALVDGDRHTMTYGEIRTHADRVRSYLTNRGVRSDDRVSVLAGNEPLFVGAALGALGVGARVIPMKPTNPLAELERKLAVIQPAVVLVGEDGQWVHDHAEQLAVPLVNITDVVNQFPNTDAPPIVGRTTNDIAFMMLTSGVSGDPKVAMLSHGSLAAAQATISTGANSGLTGDDIVFGALPVAHIFGLNPMLLTSLRVGATVILVRRFDIAESLELVRRHRITVLAGAPPMWRAWSLTDVPEGTFSSVRVALSGAAALPATVCRDMADRHGVSVEEGYGMTETGAVLTTNRGIEVKLGSVGQVVPGVEMVLVDADGQVVEPGDSGEIVVRGPNIFSGYYDDPTTTGQVLTEDGWFWTGDVGVFDDDGYLFLVDRVKDLIIVSGFNVYPAEVEKILAAHPDVTAAVVVGGENIETGETVIAHICGDPDLDELDAWAKERLTRYKCPTEYRVVDELPIAPTGKLVRRALR